MDVLPESGHQPMPQFEQPARFETRNQDDDAAVENVRQPRSAAAEPGIGRALQRDEDQRADKRPEKGSGAAQRGDMTICTEMRMPKPLSGSMKPVLMT